MKISVQTAVIGAAVVGGVLAVWQLWEKIKGLGDAVGKAGADLVPQGVIDAIAGPKAQVAASVYLPDGKLIPFSKIVELGGVLKATGPDTYEFTYYGTRYRMVPPRRPDGYYNAVKA